MYFSREYQKPEFSGKAQYSNDGTKYQKPEYTGKAQYSNDGTKYQKPEFTGKVQSSNDGTKPTTKDYATDVTYKEEIQVEKRSFVNTQHRDGDAHFTNINQTEDVI